MKIFENKKTTIAKNENEVMTYADLAKVCLNAPKQGGLGVDEMRGRIRVLDLIEKAKGKLELEDADATILQNCVKEFKWSAMHKDIVTFVDDVVNLKDKS